MPSAARIVDCCMLLPFRARCRFEPTSDPELRFEPQVQRLETVRGEGRTTEGRTTCVCTNRPSGFTPCPKSSRGSVLPFWPNPEHPDPSRHRLRPPPQMVRGSSMMPARARHGLSAFASRVPSCPADRPPTPWPMECRTAIEISCSANVAQWLGSAVGALCVLVDRGFSACNGGRVCLSIATASQAAACSWTLSCP